MGVIVLLGPQRLRPILDRVVADQGIEGKIATITAGWQEREAEDDELAAHLSGRTVNLRLHGRAEEVFEADREFAAAYRERQDSLKRAQELYRLRLNHGMAAVRDLMGRNGGASTWLEEEQDEAFEAVRRLDDGHLERVQEVHAEFAKKWSPGKRPALRKHRQELAKVLGECEAVAVAGGHVAVLLNRMRLFGIDGLIGELPVLAWSAGAMALGGRVVLFHDTPPQGFGNAEVLEAGLGLYRRIIAMPHARHRLRISDPRRVTELARRFAPRVCVPMDDGDYFIVDGTSVWAEAPIRRLTVKGRIQKLRSTPKKAAARGGEK